MDVLKAVLSINPKAELDVYEENIKTINCRGGTVPIPEAEIQTEMTRLQAEYDAQSYVRNRVDGVSGSYAASQGTGSIYPSTGEQLDMLYHELEISGSLTISGSWFNTVKSVKDANPKP